MKIIPIDPNGNLYHIQVNRDEFLALGQLHGQIGGLSKYRKAIIDPIYYYAKGLGDPNFNRSFIFSGSARIDDKEISKEAERLYQKIVKVDFAPKKAAKVAKHNVRDWKGRYSSYHVKLLYPIKDFRNVYPVYPHQCEWRYLVSVESKDGFIEGFDIQKGDFRKFYLHRCKEIVYSNQ